jgi:hypothetical protein
MADLHFITITPGIPLKSRIGSNSPLERLVGIVLKE